MKTRRLVLADEPAESRATKYIEATKSLYEKLQTGRYNNGRRRINGDVTKLRYVDGGLPPVEAELLEQWAHISQTLPGTHQVRVVMRNRLFGARCFYGDILFPTISPSERNSNILRI